MANFNQAGFKQSTQCPTNCVKPFGEASENLTKFRHMQWQINSNYLMSLQHLVFNEVCMHSRGIIAVNCMNFSAVYAILVSNRRKWYFSRSTINNARERQINGFSFKRFDSEFKMTETIQVRCTLQETHIIASNITSRIMLLLGK